MSQASQTTTTAHRRNTGDDHAPGPAPVDAHQRASDDFDQVDLTLAPVIRSKIQAPPLRSSTLSRRRLLDRLVESIANRLTLIVAEAGYGKTTLLADYSAHSGRRMLWFKLDATDADTVTWANYLVAAVREVDPKFGSATLSLLSQMATGGPPKAVITGTLVAELAALDAEETVLVLDDFHLVDQSQDVADFVARLLHDGPPWLHIVISTRRAPELQLGRLAAMGDLSELGTDDLRFSRDETSRLFADGFGQPLDDDVLEDVDERARGWAASLQLFYGSIRGRSASAIRSLAHTLSGSTGPIYDFLAEEVLANVSRDLEELLVRSALLDRILAGHVVALFADSHPTVGLEQARAWIEEADRLGLLTQSSQSSEIRQLHPLLRDFLLGHLARRHSPEQIRQMHLRLAQAVSRSDPLTACQHFVAAGANAEAMALLGKSVMQTMGSGQWGIAAELIDKIDGVPLDPAVAAIRARSLLEQGQIDQAALALRGIVVAECAPEVRAAMRHTKLALGWRTGDRGLMFATLRDIQRDRDTPQTFAEIFQIFIDSSPLASALVPFPSLANRLRQIGARQASRGHFYFSAISLHNAALTLISSARFEEATKVAQQALEMFDRVPGTDIERFSTHAVLAIAAVEQGRATDAREYIDTAVSSAKGTADIFAECAYTLATVGDRDRAQLLLTRADELKMLGRADVPTELISAFARALLTAPLDPEAGIVLLDGLPTEMPLDTGYDLDRQVLSMLLRLSTGDTGTALTLGTEAMQTASAKGARRSAVRLQLLLAIGRSDANALHRALLEAAATGDMAILVTADLIGRSLWLLPEGSSEIHSSISRWPQRWLPVLRRQLSGPSANARLAADLLDKFGEPNDVPRLRAFAKTYGRSSRRTAALGRALAKRVTPRLTVRDLGPVTLQAGDRSWTLSSMRRKAAGLLMFLVSRPEFAAGRDQTLEELWPESDPNSASNNLNQSLFYLRRDIDPWFEDDVSVEYVRLRSDVVSLDPELVTAESVEFLRKARLAKSRPPAEAWTVIESYRGQFSPEFEYEEWAMSWRTRVHAHYLQLGGWAVDRLIEGGDMTLACDVATAVLGIDPGASDIERKLVSLYWSLGHTSAAETQFAHLTARERADGLVTTPFRELISTTPRIR